MLLCFLRHSDNVPAQTACPLRLGSLLSLEDVHAEDTQAWKMWQAWLPQQPCCQTMAITARATTLRCSQDQQTLQRTRAILLFLWVRAFCCLRRCIPRMHTVYQSTITMLQQSAKMLNTPSSKLKSWRGACNVFRHARALFTSGEA